MQFNEKLQYYDYSSHYDKLIYLKGENGLIT